MHPLAPRTLRPRFGLGWLALVAACLAAGCSHLGLGAQEAARELRRQGEQAARSGDWEAAYAHLRRLRLEHPGLAETADAFPLAATAYRKLYYRDRFREPDAAWFTTEPEVLFAWLASFYREGRDPTDPTRVLLVGMPWDFARQFVVWARRRPATAGWELRVVEDNGRVESVTVVPPTAAEAPAP